jgi:hypothetical protein
VLGSTADLVDAVISTAREHVAAEAAAATRSRQLAADTANAEVCFSLNALTLDFSFAPTECSVGPLALIGTRQIA